MLTEETADKLKETLTICDLHYQRMMFAFNSIEKHFPLTEFNFSQVSPIELALFDQLIYRFSKLQDSMGHAYLNSFSRHLKKIFPASPLLISFIKWKN
jgi:hypothetical protein